MGTDQSLRIIILTGEKRAGKTTWLQKHKSGSAGFLSPFILEKRNFLLIPNQISIPMEELGGNLKVGKYSFSNQSFERVDRHVRDQFHAPELIFDEIGPLEFKGEGFAELLRYTLQNYSGKLVIVLRSGIVEEAIETFQLDRFPITVIDFEQLMNSEETELN
ncbi:nucleoside-triphosphatase [Algoriphagus marinus]|uniref:nucleoside-triphosphatase n=1 Tax=Algoriphagus marinus TaxID=1925762 RepID=UPI00094B7F5E|nr:nucleoside-triphosphatase [Algoriphagus marinus]